MYAISVVLLRQHPNNCMPLRQEEYNSHPEISELFARNAPWSLGHLTRTARQFMPLGAVHMSRASPANRADSILSPLMEA